MVRFLRVSLATMIAAACMAPPALAGGAGGACADYSVDTFLSGVSYYGTSMIRRASLRDRVEFEHRDDARIVVTLSLEGAPAEEATTRSAYLKAIDERMAAGVEAAKAQGVAASYGVYTTDPVAWSSVWRSEGQDGGRTVGVMTMRVSGSCRLVASWSASDVPILQSRVQEFGASLEAVRLMALGRVEAPDFLVDDYAPLGMHAVLMSVLIPAFLTLCLTLLLIRLMYFGNPTWRERAVSVSGGAIAAGVGLASVGGYAASFGDGKYVGNAIALACVFCAMSLPLVTASRQALVAAYSSAIIFGVGLGIHAAMGWTPNRAVGFLSAFAFLLVGAGGVALWQRELFFRRKRQPPPGEGESDGAPRRAMAAFRGSASGRSGGEA